MSSNAVSILGSATCNASPEPAMGRRRVDRWFSKSKMANNEGNTHPPVRFPEVLELDDVPIPQPGEDELLVRTRAASVNPVDYKIRHGTVPWVSREMLPITLGRDLSGTVESAGAGVDAFAEGE